LVDFRFLIDVGSLLAVGFLWAIGSLYCRGFLDLAGALISSGVLPWCGTLGRDGFLPFFGINAVLKVLPRTEHAEVAAERLDINMSLRDKVVALAGEADDKMPPDFICNARAARGLQYFAFIFERTIDALG
jgi:hypothetical protein